MSTNNTRDAHNTNNTNNISDTAKKERKVLDSLTHGEDVDLSQAFVKVGYKLENLTSDLIEKVTSNVSIQELDIRELLHLATTKEGKRKLDNKSLKVFYEVLTTLQAIQLQDKAEELYYIRSVGGLEVKERLSGVMLIKEVKGYLACTAYRRLKSNII